MQKGRPEHQNGFYWNIAEESQQNIYSINHQGITYCDLQEGEKTNGAKNLGYQDITICGQDPAFNIQSREKQSLHFTLSGAYQHRELKQTVNHGGRGVMIRVCFTSTRPGTLQLLSRP